MTSGKSHNSPVSMRVDVGRLPWVMQRLSEALIYTLILFSSVDDVTAGSDWTVEALMSLLREQRELSVPFEETTYSSLLTEPVMARGLLKFIPPDRLEKIVTAPFHEQYVVEGDRVTFESERKRVKRTVSLEDYPALRSFVEAFRSSLSGDVVQLRRVYEVTIDGHQAKWTLLLRPREPTGKSMVDYILLTGSDGQVATIAIRSPDGDRSVMTLLRGAPR